jgi:hypothetical protein
MAKPWEVIATQGIAVHGLDGGEFITGFVVFTEARDGPEVNPVGGPVTGADETFGIDEGFQPVDGVVVDPLPIGGGGFCYSAKQMGSKMRN